MHDLPDLKKLVVEKKEKNKLLGPFLEYYKEAVKGPLHIVDGDDVRGEIRIFAEGIAAHDPNETAADIKQSLMEQINMPDARSELVKIRDEAFDPRFDECVSTHFRGLEPIETKESIEEALERVRIAAIHENLPGSYIHQKIWSLKHSVTKNLRELPRQWDILKKHLDRRNPDLYLVIQEVVKIPDADRFLAAAVQVIEIFKDSSFTDAAKEAAETILARSADAFLRALESKDSDEMLADMMRRRMTLPLPVDGMVLDCLVKDLSARFAIVLPDKAEIVKGERFSYLRHSRLAKETEHCARKEMFRKIVEDLTDDSPPKSLADINSHINAIRKAAEAVNLMDSFEHLLFHMRERMIKALEDAGDH